ncbi:MAG: iron-sulfur cluster repair di-iron protein, ric [Bacilli bacterium]|nr:iron-sulfur cluster repair di-iron protein, ric [Bacilli bacterium]
MKTFNEVKQSYLKRLVQYVPIVARVHGGSHPEFHEVRSIFAIINKKIKESELSKPDLVEEFKSLRDITNNYQVPIDVCETYEAVYKMLEELDKAYKFKEIQCKDLY